MIETIKEKVANKIFPFELYISGKFNHADIIDAMCKMAEAFESLYGESFIHSNSIDKITVRETGNANDEIE